MIFQCSIDVPSINFFQNSATSSTWKNASEVHFWDDVGVPEDEQQTSPQTKGTSAVCFILTSTIVVHTLDLLGAVYVNIFSCKEFDPAAAERFTREWFGGKTAKSTFLERV